MYDITSCSYFVEGNSTYFCVGQNLRRYNLVGTEGLPRIYERCEDLWAIVRPGLHIQTFVLTLPAFLHSLATEVGKGLLIPKGIFSAGSKPLRSFVAMCDIATEVDRWLI